jgi:phosphoribosylglycinamide formyltransferase 1
MKKKIAIFASGAGSNAKRIIDYFKKAPEKAIEVALVVSNRPDAGVVNLAIAEGIEVLIVDRENFRSESFVKALQEKNIQYIALAGFLWLIPDLLIKEFPGKILNIHPALLPKYGGKGMYGAAVHKAVKEAGEKVSGISIHLVNEHFDEGEVIFSANCPIEESDTPEMIEKKVRELEIEHYPRVIEQFLNKE